MSQKEVSILVVCLGNICRSPMGHAVLEHEAKKRGLPVVVDSAVSTKPDSYSEPIRLTRALTARALGPTILESSPMRVPINHHARVVESSDFKTFDYILASDNANLSNLKSMAPKDSTATIALFGAYGDDKPIADPYYGGISGFEKAFDQCVRYSNGFLDQVFGKKESVL
ncbi:unnamed protein product [Rhizoctonia solani]|uniref:Phosphotyrosine protein phosphatase I domain-containing protein n=1 Tax=Rhizoctonia solani TaxID=456999 RepID=A0A8H2XQN6_9AGAM|nr:unnamed protein product [Rhizoctonia solani]